MNDYYEILGVSRDASADEIKKAYRKQARKLHPDYAGPESEEDFKNLQVAYDTLSDENKRAQYDRFGPEGVHGPASGGGPGAGGPNMGDFGFADIFETMFGGGGFTTATSRGPVPRQRRGQDQLLGIEVTLSEACFGVTKDINVDTYVKCERCDGSCCEPGTEPVTCHVCGGSGMVTQMQRTILGTIRSQAPCQNCEGYGTTIPSPCHDCNGTGRVRTRKDLSVDIPAGVDEGTRIRLSGKGEAGPAGGPNGDLYLEVHELKHDTFTRRGDDLHTWITLPMTTAALGTSFDLETLDGPREVTIKAGTQGGDETSMKGLGMGRLHRGGRGNLHVHVEVQTPTGLDDRQKELLEELAQLRGEDRRAPVNKKAEGVFGRIKDKLKGQ